MKSLQKIFNQLNGLHYRQEYLCLDSASFHFPLHAWLVYKGQVIKDITKQHLFVGYSPLIFALPSFKEIDPDQLSAIDILFTDKTPHPNEKLLPKDAIAMLSLKRIHQQSTDHTSIMYFEGLNGKHRFLSSFHQWIIRLNNRLTNKKTGNVFLNDNLYIQVQIAYSVPRNISLITIGENGRYNLFPTDLHGQADDEHYVISLRHQGKACQQVMQTRKILITQVHSQFYKNVYALGKNHMQEYREKSHFPFSDAVSSLYQLPLPQSATFYRELELQDSFAHGIHRILLFKILSWQPVRDNPSTLAHIHNVYATWRHNNHLPGNYLLR
ncbi:MAG: hypothetical protein ABI675_14765 [Chitinophagaceae bacterium]